MTPDQRRAIVIANEGNAPTSVGHHGPDGAAEFTRLTIDGLLNALIRIEGAEAASTYVFALADRVCGGLREPTDFRAPQLALPVAAIAEAPKPSRSKWWSAYVVGFAHALVLAWFIASIGGYR